MSVKMTLREAIGHGLPGGPILEPIDRQSEDDIVPLRPVMRWITASGGSLFKRFSFKNTSERNRFVRELLDYEESVGHSATLKVTDNEVMIALITHDLGVITEIDKEFANVVDLIYKDVVETTALP